MEAVRPVPLDPPRAWPIGADDRDVIAALIAQIRVANTPADISWMWTQTPEKLRLLIWQEGDAQFRQKLWRSISPNERREFYRSIPGSAPETFLGELFGSEAEGFSSKAAKGFLIFSLEETDLGSLEGLLTQNQMLARLFLELLESDGHSIFKASDGLKDWQKLALELSRIVGVQGLSSKKVRRWLEAMFATPHGRAGWILSFLTLMESASVEFPNEEILLEKFSRFLICEWRSAKEDNSSELESQARKLIALGRDNTALVRRLVDLRCAGHIGLANYLADLHPSTRPLDQKLLAWASSLYPEQIATALYRDTKNLTDQIILTLVANDSSSTPSAFISNFLRLARLFPDDITQKVIYARMRGHDGSAYAKAILAYLETGNIDLVSKVAPLPKTQRNDVIRCPSTTMVGQYFELLSLASSFGDTGSKAAHRIFLSTAFDDDLTERERIQWLGKAIALLAWKPALLLSREDSWRVVADETITRKKAATVAKFYSRFSDRSAGAYFAQIEPLYVCARLSLHRGPIINTALLDHLTTDMELAVGLKERLACIQGAMCSHGLVLKQALGGVRRPNIPDGAMENAIRADLRLKEHIPLTDWHAQSAVWCSLFMPLCQLPRETGCFCTSFYMAQRAYADGLVGILRDYAEMMRTDQLVVFKQWREGPYPIPCTYTPLDEGKIERHDNELLRMHEDVICAMGQPITHRQIHNGVCYQGVQDRYDLALTLWLDEFLPNLTTRAWEEVMPGRHDETSSRLIASQLSVIATSRLYYRYSGHHISAADTGSLSGFWLLSSRDNHTLTGKKAVEQVLSEAIRVCRCDYAQELGSQAEAFEDYLKKLISNQPLYSSFLGASLDKLPAGGSMESVTKQYASRFVTGAVLSHSRFGRPKTVHDLLELLLSWIENSTDYEKKLCIENENHPFYTTVTREASCGHSFLLLPGKDPVLQPLLRAEISSSELIRNWKSGDEAKQLILGSLLWEGIQCSSQNLAIRYCPGIETLALYQFHGSGEAKVLEDFVGDGCSWSLGGVILRPFTPATTAANQS